MTKNYCRYTTGVARQANATVRRWQRLRDTVSQLGEALVSRTDIDQAIGALRVLNGGSAAAVTEAGLMTDEDLVRAEGVPVCYLVEPSATWSIGWWTVHDCQLFSPGPDADRRVVSRRQE